MQRHSDTLRSGHEDPGGGFARRSQWWPMIFAAFIVVLPLPPGFPVPTGWARSLDWVGVLVFLGLFAGALHAIRTRRTVAVVTLILALMSVEVWIAALPVHFWLITCAWSAIAGASYLWVVKMVFSLDRLAKLAERERIARDLHDVLGHTLSLITLKSELAGQLLKETPQAARARREIAEIEGISRTALAEVRRTIKGYRTEALGMELERVAAMLQTAGITLKCRNDRMQLDVERDGALGMALREAVTNVVRHARARNCRIRVRRVNDVCLLEVEDDGSGVTHPEGQGMRGMRERIEALGGSVLLAHVGGTRLTVRVPV